MANIKQFLEGDVVNDTQKLAISTWTNNTNNLQVAHTSSTQADFGAPTSSGAFFIDIFNEATSSTTAEVQYAIAHGHINGSGSLNFTNDVGAKGKSATGVTYGQYRNLVFGDEVSSFTFGTHVPESIYILNIKRARYRHNLKAGTLNLFITASESPTTGMVNTLHLTDDSVSATGSSTLTNAGRQFNIVSGSGGQMSGSSVSQVNESASYGLFYPDSGFIILNGDAISHSLGVTPTLTDNATPDGPQLMYNAISGAGYFILDSEEKISSQYYFVRLRNNEFNYTTNPSFIDTTGTLNFTSMVDNPKTFITTVGLYNDLGDLVAVAKLSQPVTKDFTKEALIRVKLDY